MNIHIKYNIFMLFAIYLVFSLGMLPTYCGDSTSGTIIQSLPVHYFIVDDQHVQPGSIDSQAKAVYLWSGVVIKKSLIEPSGEGQYWQFHRKLIAIINKSDLSSYSFSNWSPEISYCKTQSVDYLKGYCDLTNGIFFQTDAYHYGVSELSPANVAKAINGGHGTIIDLTNTQ